MRKIIVIFSLIALLTFVFPVAASSPAPSFDESEGASGLVQLSYANGLVTDYLSAVWQDNLVGQISTQTQSQMRAWRILEHFMQVVEKMGSFEDSPSN